MELKRDGERYIYFFLFMAIANIRLILNPSMISALNQLVRSLLFTGSKHLELY